MIEYVKRITKLFLNRILSNFVHSSKGGIPQSIAATEQKARNSKVSVTELQNATLSLMYSRPGTHFIEGDDLFVSLFNPLGLDVDLRVILTSDDGSKDQYTKKWVKNPTSLPCLKNFTGQITIVAIVGGHANVKSNSIRGKVFSKVASNQNVVDQNRRAQHRLRSAVSANVKGALTLMDPWILPGGVVGISEAKWFATPVFEGATSLYNETTEYYKDPFKYFLTQIDHLAQAGFEFVTWHSVIDGSVKATDKSILLQFDVDAGPLSFLRIAKALKERGVVASVMIHLEAKHWYDYNLGGDQISNLKDLEEIGWTIGYHHNCLTTLAGYDAEKSMDKKIIKQASDKMRNEIALLREHFNIRTLTHHGGNFYNNSVPIPADVEIICVDRLFNQYVWRDVKSSFSDGSFTSRPEALCDWVNATTDKTGIQFMRCHPLKYGNYTDEPDVAPLSHMKSEVPSVETVRSKIEQSFSLSPIERQVIWQDMRLQTRKATALSELNLYMPISSGFKSDDVTNKIITKFRAKRRPGFVRLYPWADGDPRVIWWYLISSYSKDGKVLNVGAMPPDQKDETLAFLKEGQSLVEIDIEPEREPDILADFCSKDFLTDTKYPNVFLNGLPYFSDPKRAIENSMANMSSGGRLLVGAAGAAHPERGGWFRPDDRPVWRKGQATKGGESLSLLTTLWSFDKTSVEQLMEGWNGGWKAEVISDYWFIVADKN